MLENMSLFILKTVTLRIKSNSLNLLIFPFSDILKLILQYNCAFWGGGSDPSSGLLPKPNVRSKYEEERPILSPKRDVAFYITSNFNTLDERQIT